MHNRLILARWARKTLPTVTAAALLASCTSMQGMPGGQMISRPPETQPPAATLSVSGTRESPHAVASGGLPAPYNYGPTAMQEQGQYRAWWCSQLPGIGPAGDDILYANSRDLGSGFTVEGGAPAVPVFNGQPGGFDGMHTCDPSVVKAGGKYFLYYTGAAGDHAHGNAIGVASSTDGRAWRREAGGQPIVTASGEVSRPNTYGAGQPSVLFLDGWFYLMFTDTTAAGAGWNGAGQFVLRARNAELSNGAQVLTAAGFAPVDAAKARRSVVDAFSADWMWVDALDAFAIAHQTSDGTMITFWHREFTRQPYDPVTIAGPWREGPGLIRQPDGRAPVSISDPCGVVPFDVLRATAENPAPTDMRHFGLDVTGLRACEQPERARSILNGFAVPSPNRTVDVVRNKEKIRIERRSVAEKVVRRVLDERVPALERLPLAGTIRAASKALRSPQGEVGLLDDHGRLWTVSPEVVEANGSAVTDVSQQEWDSRARGDLRE